VGRSRRLFYLAAGSLARRPFNLGFRIALSRESEIPNLKAFPLSRCDRESSKGESRVITRLGEVGKITSKLPPPSLGSFLQSRLVAVRMHSNQAAL